MKILFVLCIVIFSVSCSSGPWSDDEKSEFKSGCINEGGTTNYCDCYLENVMTDYPIAEDFNDIDYETKIELSKDCEF